jgi:hypothetical protein
MQESVAAGFKVREFLARFAPAAIFVAIKSLGVQGVLGAGEGEEQRADLHLAQCVAVLWRGICDRKTSWNASLLATHYLQSLRSYKPVLFTASARLSTPD